jgi:glycerophosphoryl diester phosphodiesterase
MKIIAHRGASGLALENTLAALELARLLGVDAIEIDVHKTADNVLVVCHDSTMFRVSGQWTRVRDATLEQLQKITLNDGVSKVPTLQQAFATTGTVPLIVELKASGCTEELAELLKKHPSREVTIASFKHTELSALKKLGVSAHMVALERTKPFEIVDIAKREKLDGIGLNFWLLNPLTYWWIRRAGLSIYVYTINSHILGKFIGWLYPRVGICTDHPEWFIKHPWLKVKRSFLEKHTKKER